ncbi:MAG: hypothetical protein Q9202_000030 [Teloschistes flavicans]
MATMIDSLFENFTAYDLLFTTFAALVLAWLVKFVLVFVCEIFRTANKMMVLLFKILLLLGLLLVASYFCLENGPEKVGILMGWMQLRIQEVLEGRRLVDPCDEELVEYLSYMEEAFKQMQETWDAHSRS